MSLHRHKISSGNPVLGDISCLMTQVGLSISMCSVSPPEFEAATCFFLHRVHSRKVSPTQMRCASAAICVMHGYSCRRDNENDECFNFSLLCVHVSVSPSPYAVFNSADSNALNTSESLI
jgi:hypothetical protein